MHISWFFTILLSNSTCTAYTEADKVAAEVSAAARAATIAGVGGGDVVGTKAIEAAAALGMIEAANAKAAKAIAAKAKATNAKPARLGSYESGGGGGGGGGGSDERESGAASASAGESSSEEAQITEKDWEALAAYVVGPLYNLNPVDP
jgi:hypothetical protein